MKKWLGVVLLGLFACGTDSSGFAAHETDGAAGSAEVDAGSVGVMRRPVPDLPDAMPPQDTTAGGMAGSVGGVAGSAGFFVGGMNSGGTAGVFAGGNAAGGMPETCVERGDCPSEVREHGGHQYIGITAVMADFETAQQRCQDLGFDLPLVETDAEMMWLIQTFAPWTYWLQMQAPWSALTYSNWSSTQPNNNDIRGVPENCVMVQKDGKWNDLACDQTRPEIICRK